MAFLGHSPWWDGHGPKRTGVIWLHGLPMRETYSTAVDVIRANCGPCYAPSILRSDGSLSGTGPYTHFVVIHTGGSDYTDATGPTGKYIDGAGPFVMWCLEHGVTYRSLTTQTTKASATDMATKTLALFRNSLLPGQNATALSTWPSVLLRDDSFYVTGCAAYRRGMFQCLIDFAHELDLGPDTPAAMDHDAENPSDDMDVDPPAGAGPEEKTTVRDAMARIVGVVERMMSIGSVRRPRVVDDDWIEQVDAAIDVFTGGTIDGAHIIATCLQKGGSTLPAEDVLQRIRDRGLTVPLNVLAEFCAAFGPLGCVPTQLLDLGILLFPSVCDHAVYNTLPPDKRAEASLRALHHLMARISGQKHVHHGTPVGLPIKLLASVGAGSRADVVVDSILARYGLCNSFFAVHCGEPLARDGVCEKYRRMIQDHFGMFGVRYIFRPWTAAAEKESSMTAYRAELYMKEIRATVNSLEGKTDVRVPRESRLQRKAREARERKEQLDAPPEPVILQRHDSKWWDGKSPKRTGVIWLHGTYIPNSPAVVSGIINANAQSYTHFVVIHTGGEQCVGPVGPDGDYNHGTTPLVNWCLAHKVAYKAFTTPNTDNASTGLEMRTLSLFHSSAPSRSPIWKRLVEWQDKAISDPNHFRVSGFSAHRFSVFEGLVDLAVKMDGMFESNYYTELSFGRSGFDGGGLIETDLYTRYDQDPPRPQGWIERFLIRFVRLAHMLMAYGVDQGLMFDGPGTALDGTVGLTLEECAGVTREFIAKKIVRVVRDGQRDAAYNYFLRETSHGNLSVALDLVVQMLSHVGRPGCIPTEMLDLGVVLYPLSANVHRDPTVSPEQKLANSEVCLGMLTQALTSASRPQTFQWDEKVMAELHPQPYGTMSVTHGTVMSAETPNALLASVGDGSRASIMADTILARHGLCRNFVTLRSAMRPVDVGRETRYNAVVSGHFSSMGVSHSFAPNWDYVDMLTSRIAQAWTNEMKRVLEWVERPQRGVARMRE